MSFNSDYTLSYLSGTQVWSFNPSALPADKQAEVLQALQDGKLDAGEMATFAQWQKEFPQAFVKQSLLDNLPPPEEFAFQRFSIAWDSMDMNALVSMLNEQLNKMSADMRQQASRSQLNQIDHSLDLAEDRKHAQEQSAKDNLAAAVVEAALAIVSAIFTVAAAMHSQVTSAKDLIKAKNLATEKAQALCDKFKYQGKTESLDRAARKLDEQASLANKAAADAHPIGLQPSQAIEKKQQELLLADPRTMSVTQRAAHTDELKRVNTALQCKVKAEELQDAAAQMQAKAAAARKQMEKAEMRLSAKEDEIRQLDANTQHWANLYRMAPTIAQMSEHVGRILGAIYLQNAKLWDKEVDWLTALMQNTDAFADMLKNQAGTYKELNDSSRKLMEDYVNGQNEANRSIASHV